LESVIIKLSRHEILLMQLPRSFTVNYTSRNGKFAEKYPALASFPFILDSSPKFHRLANAYLVERGLGLWGPNAREEGRSARIPSPQSLRTYAQWLANFLEWADLRGVDVLTCNYAMHVGGRYQTEMLKGLWSRDGEGLSPNTVNLRVSLACEFLTWMTDTGHRRSFQIPYSTATVKRGSATSSIGHLGFEIQVREGKARAKSRSLQMPTDEQVSIWLAGVYKTCGLTFGLMCETVLLTAMRREEVVSLHNDVLHEDGGQWLIVNPMAPPFDQQVRITIRYGTKGQYFGASEQGDKIGPERDILIPLSLAKKWHAYRRKERNTAFAQWMLKAKGAARQSHAKKCVHLFLKESSGTKFTGPNLYDAWKTVGLPGDQKHRWSPHDGRHWWACSVLWRELRNHSIVGQLSNETATAVLDSTALGIIRLQIQPQLGHVDEATTMLYLRWVRDMVGLPVSLDAEDDAERVET